MKLNRLQSKLSINLEVAFENDVFVGMLSKNVRRSLADGLAYSTPIERISIEMTEERAYKYLRPYVGQIWDYFPISMLLSDKFKDHVLGIVAVETVLLIAMNAELNPTFVAS